MLDQYLAGTHIVAAAETLAFAKALGLSSREAYFILMKIEAASWIMGDRSLSMLKANWSPRSAVDIFIKDMVSIPYSTLRYFSHSCTQGIVNESADNICLACPIASTALQVFIERAARGFRRDDDSSVVWNYESITVAKFAEPENGISIISPVESTLGEYSPVILVAPNRECGCRLEEALFELQPKSVRILTGEADLLGVPEGTIDRHFGGPSHGDIACKMPASALLRVSARLHGGIRGTADYLYELEAWTEGLASSVVCSRLLAGARQRRLWHGYPYVHGYKDGRLGSHRSSSKMLLACRGWGSFGGLGVQSHLRCGRFKCTVQRWFPTHEPKRSRDERTCRNWLRGQGFARYSKFASYISNAHDSLILAQEAIKAVAKQVGFPLRMLDAAHHIFHKVRRDSAADRLPMASIVTFWEHSASLVQTTPRL